MKCNIVFACIFFSFGAFAQKALIVSSPSKYIRFAFRMKNGSPFYDVVFKGQPVIVNSPLGLAFSETGEFKNNLLAGRAVSGKGEENYELLVGKSRFVKDAYNELLIPLSERTGKGIKINFVVRVFNDGLAFRYEFPAQDHMKSVSLMEESSGFRFSGDPMVKALLLSHYTSSHEGLYTSIRLSAIKADTLIDMPALFELPGKIYASVTEADLVDYAGMYLVKRNGILSSQLSPLPGQNGLKVKASLPHKSPWRVILLNDRIGGLLESNIITSLNEPNKINDVSWIRPGKTTFPWWNGNVVPDTINAPGNNFVTNQYYIDFCARNGITYHSVVEYGLHQWYVDDGTNFQPGPNADVTRAVPGLDMKEVCDYARSKGVGVRVWVHWAALYPKLDTAFAVFEKWGLEGMMVDFMDRDDQEMVNIQEEILQKAARHRLHVQFHGAYKPTGRHRTYPNEFTREGTLNYEVNKWDRLITPDHDLDIVFTRLIAGSTDYHLGGFRAVPDSLFRIQYTRPLMMGTRCHMMAMYVVLENYLGMVCDYPAAYEGEPGFDFIRRVPTTWDETKVLDAELNKYIVMARRKGKSWFIGSINNNEARNVSINLNFLPEGNYRADIYTDGPYTQPNQLNKQERTVTRKDILLLTLAKGGGFAIEMKMEN